MFDHLPTKRQQLLAVALLLLTIMLTWLLITPLLSSAESSAEKVDDLRFQLTRYRTAIEEKAALETEYANLNRQLAEENLFHRDIAPGVAAATLQNRAREAVEKFGGSLISTQVLADKTDSHFTQVAINVRFTGNGQVLQALLLELEGTRPVLSVEKISVVSKRRPSKQRPSLLPLNITLEITSFLASDGS
ncbi:MAG: hypothetical protein DRQ52_08050 [Gammaproteobacteria bacterium]|nr:MAG: hypothetical protein DRQ52_08050 [Gammaproteobacteria bacterium]RLA44077.1 MAG: hypothetical protein DRR42_20895 [Gammaproteobacteria bacterium]